jgi:hypothetical protein
LETWAPPNAARLHGIVLLVEQEARYYPLRMSALDDVASWKAELSREELDRRLAAGLHDPAAPVRRKAMLIAGRIQHAPSMDILMRVLNAETIVPQPLPDVPTVEAVDVPEVREDVAPGCSDRDVAALGLAYGQHAAAKQPIAAIHPSTAMLDVSLALLGDGDRLKQEHFASANGNQELQLAAVEATIRCRGRHGLQLALGYRQATHWWEEEYVARRLSQMLVAENAPDSERLIDCESLKTLQQWFADHGTEYLKRLEKSP